MARQFESWQMDTASLAPQAEQGAAGLAATDEIATCTCPEYRRDKVCDHVLMAAAVRMVRRMIDAHTDAEKPH